MLTMNKWHKANIENEMGRLQSDHDRLLELVKSIHILIHNVTTYSKEQALDSIDKLIDSYEVLPASHSPHFPTEGAAHE